MEWSLFDVKFSKDLLIRSVFHPQFDLKSFKLNGVSDGGEDAIHWTEEA